MNEVPVPDAQRLALSLRPGEGESLRSYVERLAAHHLMPLADMLAVLDLACDAGKPLNGFGVTMTSEQRAHVVARTGLTERQVDEMLLSRYRGSCLSPGNPGEQVDARLLAIREWVHVTSSYACPACLEEDGYWRLAWKLPWSAACVRHKSLLLSRCPQCDLRLASGKPKATGMPTVMRAIPEPLLCENTHPDSVGGQKRICGAELTEVGVEYLDDYPHLLAAQRIIDRDLARAPDEKTHEQWARRRSISAFLLAAGDRESLPADLPVSSERSWANHVARRERSGGGRAGRRVRAWTETPSDPALTIALLTSVLAIEADPAKLSEDVERLVDLGHSDLEAVATWTQMPDDLFNRVKDAARSDARYRFSVREPVTHAGVDYVPRALPERYWGPLAVLADTARSGDILGEHLSLAVIRHGQRMSWEQAAEELGLSPQQARRGNHVVTTYTGRVGREQFWNEIEKIDAALREEAVNYRELERALVNFREIPEDAWQLIAYRLGITSGKTAARRRNAAAWLWSQITCAPVWEAPAWQGVPSESRREVYRRFLGWMTERLATALLEWGDANLPKTD